MRQPPSAAMGTPPLARQHRCARVGHHGHSDCAYPTWRHSVDLQARSRIVLENITSHQIVGITPGHFPEEPAPPRLAMAAVATAVETTTEPQPPVPKPASLMTRTRAVVQMRLQGFQSSRLA